MDSLRLALIRLAKQYGRFGYRKKTQLLRVEGWDINQFEVTVSEARVSAEERVERLWREEGLQLPQRHKKRKRLYHKDSSVIRLRPKYPNHIWSVDFVYDRLSNGRPYKMLTVIDEFTREALTVSIHTKMNAEGVFEAPNPLLLKHRGRVHTI
ncbi:MAG: DDE-type integrase/transposase/recombinase [Pseudomonadota bacterium]